MAKIKGILLTDQENTAREKAWRQGKSHEYRQRCQMILLKSQPVDGQYLRSQEVAKQVGCCQVVVNTWLKRYQEHGLAGLAVKPGRGRKTILSQQNDLAAVRRAVQSSRQRVSLAKAELQEELGKEFSHQTLTRFLKKTVAASSEFDDR